MNIAFIGLGNMGAPMARNLIKAGHSLQLFDLNKAVLAYRGRCLSARRHRSGTHCAHGLLLAAW